ncbi:MAG: hypothetical protein AAB731_01350 [Patescibacteria group bacterium]
MAKHFMFVLSDAGDEGLVALKVLTDASTKCEVIRDALALYEVLVQLAVAGNKLVLVHEDTGESTDVLLPSLERRTR